MNFLLISDFTIDSLAGLMRADTSAQLHDVDVADIGHVIPALIKLSEGATDQNPQAVVVWTRPENTLPGFGELQSQNLDTNQTQGAMAAVDEFANHLLAAAQNVEILFVPTWTQPPYKRGLGLLNMKPGHGYGHLLAAMNLRLMERLADAENIHVLDGQRWMTLAGAGGVDPKQWYLSKAAFSLDVFKEALLDIKAGLMAVGGQAKKLLVLDLDDTLWGGVVGDVGTEGLVLGGHNAQGEAFVDFQKEIKNLQKRGILLALVSKNDEKTALDAIRNHPEMILKVEDFASWRINWEDKAQNIADLTSELNLGLQSVVFIDDNAFERGRVQEALPEVLVPKWPKNAMLYCRALEGLRCFDTTAITQEDLSRQTMVLDERTRENHKSQVGSLTDWLNSLELTVTVEALDKNNLKRATQLLNKTNQGNMRTRRLTESELTEWVHNEGFACWVFGVRDRFGDSGLTGLMSLVKKDDKAEVIDFVVSCRVFNRGVEQAMLHKACSHCADFDISELSATFVPTKKNNPCLEFWQTSGFNASGPDGLSFVWDLATPFAAPSYVKVEG